MPHKKEAELLWAYFSLFVGLQRRFLVVCWDYSAGTKMSIRNENRKRKQNKKTGKGVRIMSTNRKVRKLLGGLLAGALVISCLGGCGNKNDNKKESVPESKTGSQAESSSEQESTVKEIETEGVTLKIAWLEHAEVTAHAKDLSQTAFGKAWQEATGISFEVMNMADDQAFNLMFSSGELPDIIYTRFASYPGGPQGAIADGIIEPLNDYMDCAPNLKAVLDGNESYQRDTITNNGDIIGFPWIRDDSQAGALSVMGLAVRQDWLDDLGLKVPTTADEFYQVLKAFKEEKGAEYPLTAYSPWHFRTLLSEGMITSPFGLVKADFYQKDGKVHFGYAEQEYKDALTWLNKMYNEGLIDPNFASIDGATFDANMTSGVSGMGVISANTANRLTTAMADSDPEYDLVGIAPLRTADGKISMSSQYSYPIDGYYAVITPNCKNKEAAAMFLDYGYSEEGSKLFNFGLEGVNYEMKDGVPVETDLVLNNPDGWSAVETRAYYQLGWDSGPMVQLYVPQSVPERTRQARANFDQSDIDKYLMPQLYFDQEVSAEISKYKSEIYTLTREMLGKYIMGTESLNSFDDYVATLYELGLDKVLAYYQEALDAYQSK